MGDKLIQGKTLLMRDAIYIGTLLISCIITYMTTANTAESALIIAQENKAFGMARDKKISEVEKASKEYARDYSYRKDAEIIKDVEDNSKHIHLNRESIIKISVETSHIKENQKAMLELLQKINNKH
ncbi:MAG: hypothetical protein CML44_02930 [Rhodobacteraceae bacterium]|nr:hypothetical protein [Paracoccaceae bacterium]|tara:strand:+ start:453 stop:833 length:381 start_codon:yes stop_codon:yes gene_type:complete